MNVWKIVAVAAVMLGCSAQVHAQASCKTYTDRDWSVSFYDNCGFPVTMGTDQSVSWVTANGDRKLRFILRPGDRGRCYSDNEFRHRARFWERAEVREAGALKLGGAYRIEAEFTPLQGFTGERETFFQIHGWAKGCETYPPIMLKFDRGRLQVWVLRGLASGQGGHKAVQTHNLRVKTLIGQANQLVLDFDTRTSPGQVSVMVNGQSIVSNAAVEFADCAKPHVKMGIYRPGGKGSGTSEILFDDLTITQGP